MYFLCITMMQKGIRNSFIRNLEMECSTAIKNMHNGDEPFKKSVCGVKM